MTEPHPEAVPLRTRTLLFMPLEDQDSAVCVDHVYLAEGEAGTCEHCGGQAHDPGQVGLIVGEENVLLTAEEALVIANRLTRAAELVLESMEDAPDLERDMARFAAATGKGPE